MTPDQALARHVQAAMALLEAAYPGTEIKKPTRELYTVALFRLGEPLCEVAVRRVIATCARYPSLAELLRAAADVAVGAPDTYTAWEQVQAAVAWRPTYDVCPPCGGSGLALLDNAQSPPCPRCGGHGEVQGGVRPLLHPLVHRAVKHYGGVAGIKASKVPEITRAQFERTYRDLVRQAWDEVRYGGNWQAVLNGRVPVALGPGSTS